MRKALAVTCAIFISADILGMISVHKKDGSFIQNQLVKILGESNKIQSESINLDEVTKPVSLNSINQEKIPELIEKRKKLERFLVKKHNELMNAIQINKMYEVAQIICDVTSELYFAEVPRSLKNLQPLDSEEIQKRTKIVKKNFALFMNATNNVPGHIFTGKTPLSYAMEIRNMEAVNYLLDYNVNIENTGGYASLIIWVIKQNIDCAFDESFRKNKLEILEKLLKHFNTNPNVTDEKGNTPLFYAVDTNDIDVVKLLIENGAEINQQNIDGDTPLLMATRKNHENIAKFLVEHDADVNVKNKKGNTPLICAAKKINLRVLKYLISKGADVNTKNNDGDSPLMLLIKKKSSNNSSSQNLSSAEREARQERHTERGAGQGRHTERGARQGRHTERGAGQGRHTEREVNKFKIIQELLKHPNIDPNITDNEGNTSLHHAILRKKVKIINALLNHPKIQVDTKDGGDLIGFIKKINTSDNTQLKHKLNFDSLLIKAVCQNNFEKVKLFMNCGAGVNVEDENGDTPLIHACYSDYKIAEFLVKSGANINNKGSDSLSPLATAIIEKRSDIVELLLQYKASTEGLTIFDATRADSVPLAEVFLKNDSDSIDLVDMMENTPLHSACYNESFDVAKLLLENNADIEKKNLDDETPLSIINKKIQEKIDPQIKAKAKEILQKFAKNG